MNDVADAADADDACDAVDSGALPAADGAGATDAVDAVAGADEPAGAEVAPAEPHPAASDTTGRVPSLGLGEAGGERYCRSRVPTIGVLS